MTRQGRETESPEKNSRKGDLAGGKYERLESIVEAHIGGVKSESL